MTDWFMTATQSLGLCWFWLYPRLPSQCTWKLVVCLLWPLRCRAGLGLLNASALWVLPTPGCVALFCFTPVLVRQTFTHFCRSPTSRGLFFQVRKDSGLLVNVSSDYASSLAASWWRLWNILSAPRWANKTHLLWQSSFHTVDQHLPTFLTRISFHAPHKS